MTDTANLALPLVQPAQAQKHVTVNEALARIDGLAQLTLQSVSETVPPVSPAEGTAYGVPSGAVECLGGAGGACGGRHRRRLGLRSGAARVARHGAGSRADGGLRRRGLAHRRGDADAPGAPRSTCGRWSWTSRFRRAHRWSRRWPFRRGPSPSGSRAGSRRRSRARRHRWEIGVAGDTARYGTGLGLG
jgi:hypothetical protein